MALLGGTFNPVHYGHLSIAEIARETHGLDRVIFVPSGLPPHKKTPRTSIKHRLAMLRLALRNNPAFQVSDWEIRQKRVVYTYETLEHFRRQWPGVSLYFIVGSDAMKQVAGWKESKRLRSLARFISMDRELPYASREIRSRVKARRSIRYQVPDAVERYIQSRHLYLKPE